MTTTPNPTTARAVALAICAVRRSAECEREPYPSCHACHACDFADMHEAQALAAIAAMAPQWQRIAALEKFWADCASAAFEGNDIGGEEVQEMGAQLGLLTCTTYDPEIHGESTECAPGDPWYVLTPPIALPE